MAHTHIQRIKQIQGQQNRFDDYSQSQRSNSATHIGSMASAGPASIISSQQFGSQSSLSRIMSGSAYFPLRAAAASGGGQSNFGGRSASNSNLVGLSTSLAASKASLATFKSGKSCIQQEYKDLKVQRRFRSITEGQARQPFLLSLVCFFVALACLIAGLTVVIKRAFGQLFLTVDKGEFIGPGVACLSLVFISLGINFLHTAYKRNAKEQSLIRFKASNSSLVSVKKNAMRKNRQIEQDENLVSGTATKNAVTRTPVGSLHSLNLLSSS